MLLQIKAMKEEDKMKIQSAESLHKFDTANKEIKRLQDEHMVEVSGDINFTVWKLKSVGVANAEARTVRANDPDQLRKCCIQRGT
jgi:hypothetical protein